MAASSTAAPRIEFRRKAGQPAIAIQVAVPHRHTSFIADLVWPSLRFPWDLYFHGRKYYESVSDYPLGIALVLFAPVWLRFWR